MMSNREGDKRRSICLLDVLLFFGTDKLKELAAALGDDHQCNNGGGRRRLAAIADLVLDRRRPPRVINELRVRTDAGQKKNVVEVWRGFPLEYAAVPFPDTRPPPNIVGFKELTVVHRVCVETHRLLQLSKRLLRGCELVVEDWHAFCSRHEIGLVDDFLNLFADGMVYRIEVDRPTTDSEPFLSHPAVQHCGRLAVFDPDPEFGWTEIVDWLHGRPPKNKDEPTRMLQLEANELIVESLLGGCIKKFECPPPRSPKRLQQQQQQEPPPQSPLPVICYAVKIFNGEAYQPLMKSFMRDRPDTGERLTLDYHCLGPCNRFHLLRRWRPSAADEDVKVPGDGPLSPPPTPTTPAAVVFSDKSDERRTKVVVQMLDDEE